MPTLSVARVESADRRKAKIPRAQPCPSKGTGVHQILPFELFLRAVWPSDRIKNIQKVTNRSERAIKYQLAGRAPGYEDIVKFLRSDYGFEFLEHVMGDAKPNWWSAVQKARGLGDMRRQLNEQQRRIAQLEMAVD
jgi:hypothetical protein